MLFERMRSQMKWIIVVVAVAFAVTLLYVGVPFFFRGEQSAQAAIANVNGQSIDLASFQRTYLDQLRAYEQSRGTVRPTDIEEIKYQALSQLINMRLLVQAARDEGIKVNRKDVDARFNQVRDGFPSEAEFRRQLQLRNMTEQDLRKAIEDGLMAEKLQEKLASGIQVSDQEVARAYEQVHVRQILVRPARADDAGWAEAKRRAEQVQRDLKAGADFAALAKKYSDDEATKAKGGDLGMLGRGALPAPVEAVAFQLAKGAVSQPVKSDLGYHIVQVLDRKEARGPEFEKEKPQLVDQLRQEKANEAFAKWFADLRRQASVSILDPQLAAREALARGDAEQALALYRQAAEKTPDDAYVQYGIGATLMGLKKLDEAVAAFQKATELAPSDPVLQLALGNAYQQKGDKAKAAAAFRKASELSPMDLQMHLTLYMMFSSLGLKDDAAREEQELEKIQKVMEEQQKAQEEFMKRLQEQQQKQSESSAPPQPQAQEQPAPSQPSQATPQPAQPKTNP
ncbi:peptidylprolyl isomerase [Carboxydochorda subterranea]|uniref:Peptidylprolyl isomerase n=1 Tax=Carboxydichorda subterranea TaxID=3109565 RepID=A0ABZ1C0D7_9FIRM|nr:peptidylprolyl isomerase [Limnochorda sp. L945t]WRP18300.1 peptidylprolyl isomerase [Limnochorda sp. L945t]